MATTITKTVKSSGGDYTSRSAWEAGRQGNLPTLDQIEKAEVYAFSDTTACLIDGWTTDATRYWWIYVPAAERHDGKWNSSKARLEYTATAASQSCFRSLEDYGTLEGDQLSITLSGNTGCRLISFNSQTATNNKQIFKQVIGKNISGGTGMQGGVYTLSANTIMVYADCIFYDFDTSAGAYLRDGGASAYFYNCTFHNSSKGIDATGKTDTVTAKNCLFKSCTTAAAGTFAAGTDYNATNNASMGYSVTGSGNTHDRTSQTFTFVDEANDDFHLSSSDAGAKDYGVDLSGDSVYAFSVDIDDVTRSGTWDIGADEYVASGGTTYTRTLSDSVATSDSPIRRADLFRQIPIDSVTLNELLMKGTQFGRVTNEQIDISDSILRAAKMYRAINENAIINDGILRYAQLVRNLLDQFAVNDLLIVSLTVGGVTIVSRVLTDNINIDDLVSRVLRIYRLESQVVDVYDGSWYSASVVRQTIDILTASETIARSLQRSRVIADTTDVADIAFRYALLNRLLHDDATASDSLTTQLTYFQQLLGFILQSLQNEPINQTLTEGQPITMELTKA